MPSNKEIERKLEIGSGLNPHEGYDHLDVNQESTHLEFCASMDSLPISEKAYNKILAVHVIEHYPWNNQIDLLKEWYRVLKINGILEIHTPNLEYIIKCYLTKKWKREIKNPDWKFPFESDQDKSLWANFKLFSVPTIENDRHFCCYDFKLLKRNLVYAGFKSVKGLMYGVKGHTLVVMAKK